MVKAISYRLKYEQIYYSNIQHFFNVNFRKWVSTAIQTRMNRDFKHNRTCEWDKEFAWSMWGWFVQGLELGLIGDDLFEFIDNSYWEEVLDSED